MTASDVRLFTLQRANSALPLVRRIMDDIMAEHPQWKDLVSRYELVAAGARPEWGESPEMLQLRRQIDTLAGRINGYFAELAQVGCEIKDLDQGLVDFNASYQGRLVYLCWQSGEQAITHWHERDTGFAGRQSITPEFEATVEEEAAAPRAG
jgi:hypothetical protein